MTDSPNPPQHYGKTFTNHLELSYPSLQPTTHKLMAYKPSIHSSTNQTPAVLEVRWNPRLPQDSLGKDSEAYSKVHGGLICICQRPVGQITCNSRIQSGDLVLLSTTNFNKIKGCKKLKDSFAGPFVNKALHGENAVEVELSEELSNKHPTFPVSLIKPYKSGDSEKFPLRNKVPQHIPPVESPGTKKITRVLKERKLRAKKVREYLVRYSDPTCEAEWLAEKEIPEAMKLPRRFRHTINNNNTK
ncbi:hypothetical protein O181_037328 [Austropuccinia psidii MF-1]|uniref:Tf2-1-like SH3-like domain-containing protein n=1 Tax=Austropuccinia psidii MF-1 TaxID=1389203 RepID=A0A9Q3D962_9BASI|nr:hypothetical protein [Austropuccinia psidii MF-1]